LILRLQNRYAFGLYVCDGLSGYVAI